MKDSITTYPSRQFRRGSASLLFVVYAAIAPAGYGGEPSPAASDEPSRPLASGDTVVLTGPDVYLVEREDLGRAKGVTERLIPGRDRLFYKVEPNRPNNLRLIASMDDVSMIPTDGKGLTIVADVNHVLHFRIFDIDGKVVVDTNETKLTDRNQQVADLRKQLERLWPLSEPGKREKLRVIGAVNSVVGYTAKDADRIRLVSVDEDRQGRVSPQLAVRATEAVAYFTQQIAREPRNAGAYWMRARLCLEQKDREGARADIDRAIEIEPRRAALYVTRGMISMRDGKLDQVLADCNMAVELDAAESWAYVIRANVWLTKRDHPHALADLNQVIRIDGAHPLDWSARFRYWLHVKDRDYANRDKNEGAPLDPEIAISHLWRGDVWCADQDASRAVAEYSEAIRIEPLSAVAYSRRASAWAKKHDRENEIADLSMAIKLEPTQASYRVARAESYSARGRHELAMVDYNSALRLEPDSTSIWLSRGNEWRRELKLDNAITDYTYAIHLNPRYAPAYVARGNVWKQREVFNKAIEEFSFLIRLEPENALGHQALARILATCYDAHYRNGQWAIDEAKKACELTHWRDPDCLDTFAAACAEVGDFESAIKWQKEAIRRLADNAPSILRKSMDIDGRRGVQFEDRLAFYKSKKPTRE